MSDGNAAQTRVIGEQLLAIWDREREARKPWWSGPAPGWAAFLLSLTAVVWNAAIISGSVTDNRRRIETLEVKQERAATDNHQVIDRLARIEAKLDIMGAGK